MQEIDNNVQEVDAVQVLKDQAALSLILKAEIDTQIATAQAFPRSLKKFLDKTMSIATINEDVAQSCAYALPRGKNDNGTVKVLEGPSVRLAEIVASSYGNMRVGARVIHNDGKTITAQGICHDLESNTCVTFEVKRSIMKNEYEYRNGKSVRTGRMIQMTEDMQIVTGNAACAIAFRNVVFKIIPTALIEDIYEKVKEVAKGTAATLGVRRTKAMAFLTGMGISEERIFSALGVAGLQDIDLDNLAKLSGMKTLIKNGESTAAEIFPDINKTPLQKRAAATDATSMAIKDAAKKALAK